uniref:Uncharacterized protein n=1 Tax=Panagrolaimus sp. ES5 TaxID=591445 RepID=A0AC34F5L0_9BILA
MTTADRSQLRLFGIGKNNNSNNYSLSPSSLSGNGRYSSSKISKDDEIIMDSTNINHQRKRRVSEFIIRVPIDHLKKIGATDELNSLSRETQSFVGIATIHGLLRIYRGRGIFRLLWILVTIICVFFFLYQLVVLINQYQQKPTASHVSFILPEDGMAFPSVTICNYNSIRQSFVAELNRTTNGSFSYDLLKYLALSYLEVQLVVTASDEFPLQMGEELLQNFTQIVPNFTINGFFSNAGPLCDETLLLCSFGGREFNCCKYAQPILTDMGLCYRLELAKADEIFLQSQIHAGVANGLQIIADCHKEDQIEMESSANSDSEEETVDSFLRLLDQLISGIKSKSDITGLFAQVFDVGFRYYVHSDSELPALSSEGITVSPGTRVYSAVSPNRFKLLPEESWGNCTERWPDDLNDANIQYSSTKCKSLCRAKYYNDLCGCSPFIYNVKGADITAPVIPCPYCKLECDRWVYHTYNSYGEGFSEGALDYLKKRLPWTTKPHIKSNFVTINIFYRDMAYTQYEQMQSTTFTQVMSNIGGNMGMTLGMSLISIIEIIVYLSKTSWIFLSKKRREHLVEKKHYEKQREQTLKQTLEKAQQESSPHTFRRIANSIRRKVSQVWPKSPTQPKPNSTFFSSQLVDANLRGDGKITIGHEPIFAEVKVDADQILEILQENKVGRPRSVSCPRTYSRGWKTNEIILPTISSSSTIAISDSSSNNSSKNNNSFDIEKHNAENNCKYC